MYVSLPGTESYHTTATPSSCSLLISHLAVECDMSISGSRITFTPRGGVGIAPHTAVSIQLTGLINHYASPPLPVAFGLASLETGRAIEKGTCSLPAITAATLVARSPPSVTAPAAGGTGKLVLSLELGGAFNRGGVDGGGFVLSFPPGELSRQACVNTSRTQ